MTSLLPTLPLSKPAYDLNGKVALVTGAAQGIGLAASRLLHDRGASIVLVDINTERVTAAASTVGERAIGVGADVRDRDTLRLAVDAAIEHFGRLDVVVANAGVAPTPATIRIMDDVDFDFVLGVNLTGAYNTVRAGIEQVIEHRGHMVVVSSAAAFSPGPGGCSYMISKAGVEQLGRALRIELAPHGASAQIAYFGVVETPMTHETMDGDDYGRELGAKLPWPLNRRISPEAAARSLVDGIAARSQSTIAPAGWQQYGWLRGALNPVIDTQLLRDKGLARMLRQLEERHR